MPEVLGGPPSPQTVLFWNGAAWQWALVDAAGHLQLDVVTSGLPAGAATAANQATMITALQLIDDLRNALDSVGTDELDVNVEASVLPTGAATQATLALALAQLQLIEDMRDALQSVATDRLIVRGEDQLFSIEQVVHETRVGVVSGAGGFYDSQPVPAGRYWAITTIFAYDTTTPATAIRLQVRHDGADYLLSYNDTLPAAWAVLEWGGHVFLDPSDVIRAVFTGALAGDTCEVVVGGYQITIE